MSFLGNSVSRWAFALLATSLAGCSLNRSVVSSGDAGSRVDSPFDSGNDEDVGNEDDVGVEPDVSIDEDGGSDGGSGWVVDYRGGTFSRSSEASFLSRAPDETGGFITWAPAGALRFEDRGDGAGALLLVEGARTNLLQQSRDPIPGSAWPLPGGGVAIDDDVSPGPDGVMSAHRLTAAGYSRGQAVPSSAGPHTLSAWGRATAGTSVWTANFSYVDQPSVPAWYVPAQAAVWTRQSDIVPQITSGTYYPIDLNIGPGVLDLLLDLHQVEAGSFASSVIRTAATSSTRDADVLTFASTAAPAQLFVARGHFSEVSPIFASTMLATGDEVWLLGIAGGNGIRLRHDGTAVVVEAVEGGLVRATSLPLAFAAHQLIGRVEWSPDDGQLLVSGASGPTGTPWSWPPGDVRIGGIVGGAGEAFARLGELAGD